MIRLVDRLGEMPEQEQVLHDLDMIRLLRKMDTRMSSTEALAFLQKYLCYDGTELRERSLLLGELYEKSSQEELDALCQDLAALAEERRKYEQAAQRIHQLLYIGRRSEIHIRCIEKLAQIGSRGFASERMNALTQWIEKVRQTEEYHSCAQALREYHGMIVFPKMMRVGINTQEDARPVEMGVVALEEEASLLNPLLGTEDASQPAKSLFPEMIYNRELYGTHFEEYLARNLEKQWKGKITKAAELWKKVIMPWETELEGLYEELAFYAVGLRVMNAFQAYRICRPEILSGTLLKAEEMVYPELALSGERVQGNPVRLEAGGAVIVTGANHSGKTSYLKTVGQTILLAQLGFYVPAASMSFCPVHDIYTLFSAGEDREMTASRMGIEIQILARMLEQASKEDLVLINEPLTSTNPVEAISICAELMQKFLARQVPVLMVTHLYDVYFLLRTTLSEEYQPRLKSLVTDAHYDQEKGMLYSYRLMESEPLGNSYARQTAESFGITLHELMKDEKSFPAAYEFCEREGQRAMYTREEADHGRSD